MKKLDRNRMLEVFRVVVQYLINNEAIGSAFLLSWTCRDLMANWRQFSMSKRPAAIYLITTMLNAEFGQVRPLNCRLLIWLRKNLISDKRHSFIFAWIAQKRPVVNLEILRYVQRWQLISTYDVPYLALLLARPDTFEERYKDYCNLNNNKCIRIPSDWAVGAKLLLLPNLDDNECKKLALQIDSISGELEEFKKQLKESADISIMDNFISGLSKIYRDHISTLKMTITIHWANRALTLINKLIHFDPCLTLYAAHEAGASADFQSLLRRQILK